MQPLFLRYWIEDRSFNCTLIDCLDHLNPQDVADQIYATYPRELEDTDVLIVRPSNQSLSDAIDRSKYTPFSERAPRASVHLLTLTHFQPTISENLNTDAEVPVIDLNSREFSDWLRESELREYMQRSDALLHSSPNFLYRSPSNAYVDKFLRVGNIQTSRQAIDAFFFWMAAFLKDCGGILTETWSISSIALNASRLVERYSPETHPRVRVDTLSLYHDGSSAVFPEVQDALQRLSAQDKPILVLISAIGTANSYSRLRRTLEQQGNSLDRFVFLALFRLTSGSNVDALCDLSRAKIAGQDMFALDLQSHAQPGTKPVIEIDPRTYFPLQIKDTSALIRKPATVESEPFFSTYQGLDIISVHRDALDLNSQKLRHHGIDIDVEKMLQHPSFSKKLSDTVKQLGICPDMIVIPPHKAGQQLANFVRNELHILFEKDVDVLVHPNLHPTDERTPKERISNFSADATILLLDDVSVTGGRLNRYQANLRKMNFKGRIIYLIGVARPEDRKIWAVRERNLRYRAGYGRDAQHLVRFVEMILLPDWNETRCPWCQELEGLRILSKADSLPQTVADLIVERQTLLQNSPYGSGLTDNAVWRRESSVEPHMTAGSIFLDYKNAKDADVIGAVAAAIQQLRVRDNERLGISFPHATILDPSQYTGNKDSFNDAILWLAILKGAYRNELVRWVDQAERDRQQAVKELFLLKSELISAESKITQLCVQLEIAANILTRKLPLPRFREDELENIDPTLAELIKMITLNQ